MELYEVMRTTFAARDFTDDPLPDSVLERILDNARFAPSGGNRQGWHVIAVRNQDTRERLVDLAGPAIKRYIAQVKAGENPWNAMHPTEVSDETIEATPVASFLTNQFLQSPVVLMLCVDLGVVASMDQYLDRVGVISGASIYPLAWNILLAARNEGFGGTLTTFLSATEPEVQSLLGIPPHFAVAAAITLGKPVKQLTKLSRKPVNEIATWERFDGKPIG
ncbi:MAG: nitroreductase family protein [Pseudomonadota bacterium]